MVLENLSKEIKIGLIVIIAGAISGASIMLVRPIPTNIGRAKRFGPVIVSLLVAAYLIYNIVSDDEGEESFHDYTSNSPTDTSKLEPKCYSEGDEVPCDLVEDEEPQINNNDFANDVVGGSHGVDQDETYKSLNSEPSNNQLPNECYPKDILSPKELLPKDSDSTWAQSVPAGQGSLGDQNFLNAGFHIGVNTVGQTLRNPNYGIRSEPPNPQIKVSPWMQTTIEPDSNRRPMEIGGSE